MFPPGNVQMLARGLICIALVSSAIVAGAQDQRPLTRYAVSPAKVTVWAQMHDPLSDEDIAKVNLELFAKGDKRAAWELGLQYMQGLGVAQDFAKAERMFQIGAVDANEKGMVGMFHATGYFPKDLDAVERWYTAAGRPQDYFELAETFKAAAESDKSSASRYYPKATAIFLRLLSDPGQPQARRAQLELGNFVIDGTYSAGDHPQERAQNLEWARMIAQELLGQQEYDLAVDYGIGREDLPVDRSMWLHFCKRAAAYNIDLAQHFYAEGMMSGDVPDLSGYDYVAWTRLASQKQTGESGLLKAITKDMSPEQSKAANAAYNALLLTRKTAGAYYPADDLLRNPAAAVLASMPNDDPDVQLRKAFALERAATLEVQLYAQVLSMYRAVRDQRQTDIRFALARDSLTGANGVPKSQAIAEYWFHEAANRGSIAAKEMLAKLSQ